MKKLTREESGWALARVWLVALEESSRDFFGNRPRNFAHRAYEHATEAWLRILENDYGIKARRDLGSIREAIDSYIELGVRGGLFEDHCQFELDEVTPLRIKLKVFKCAYLDSCTDLMEQGIAVSNLTCARIGCFNSAVKLLAGIDCTYDVDSVCKERGCTGVIYRK